MAVLARGGAAAAAGPAPGNAPAAGVSPSPRSEAVRITVTRSLTARSNGRFLSTCRPGETEARDVYAICSRLQQADLVKSTKLNTLTPGAKTDR